MGQRRTRASNGAGVIDPARDDDELESMETAGELDGQMLGDLAILSGIEFQDVDWYIYRLRTKDERAANPGGKPRELVARRSGPLDLIELVQEIGGGDFDFYPIYDAGDGTGKRLQRRQRHSLAGPRKNFSAPPVTATVTPNGVTGNGPPMTRAEKMMLRLLRDQGTRLAALETKAVTPPPQPMSELIGALKGLDELRGRGAAPTNPDREVVNTLVQVLNQGIAIGAAREPVTVVDNGKPDGPDWGAITEKLLPFAERLLTRRRGPAPSSVTELQPVPNGAPAQASTPAEEPKQLGIDDIRWIAVGDALTRAIAEGADPAEFAGYLECQLTAIQLLGARTMTVEDVLKTLLQYEPESQVLKSPAAAPFIAAVLRELNDTGESEPPGQ